MRIIFGAYGQGHGHFSKAAVLVPILERMGHDVRVVSSGPEQHPEGFKFGWHRHYPGFAYEMVNGKASPKKTIARWLKTTPRTIRHFAQLRRLVNEFEPELIISDFEPMTASHLLQPRCEVISLCRQATLLDKSIPLPDGDGIERHITKGTTKLFTAGATRLLGYHYTPASYRCVPPILRSGFDRASAATGEHVVVYNHYHFTDGGDAESLIAWADRTRTPVRAYGYPQMERGQIGHVDFRPADRIQMPLDMAGSRAIMTTSGFTTPIEAFRLGKPLCIVPLPGNWEQKVNACQLHDARIGSWLKHWDFDALLDQPAPASDHPLTGWLSATPEQVIASVLGEEPVTLASDVAA